jgi:serine/threonine protein kinase/Tol biopolymer transport system component
MALTSGTKLGPYEIQSPLGAGGMGEVYRARDTRLDRTVAIKVLPTHLSADPELRQRFDREAKAISALQHPNICTLHDVGSQDGVDFLVMEYLEGQTLADRLVKGALPLDQVLKIGTEIAEALEKAHRQGIVHRDLKPGNIMLTKSGAKLMDFGLAKPELAMAGSAKGQLTPSTPTMNLASLTSAASPLTQKGSIVGTFQYLSPEVLQGAEADARSDIFSFGCVLYEMVAGRRAFEGKSQLGVLTAILEKEPEPITASQPPALDRVIRACLAKDPADRFQSAHDVAMDLRWVADSAGASSETSARKFKKSWVVVAAAVFLVCIALASLVGYRWSKQSENTEPIHAEIPPPDKFPFDATGDNAGMPVLSPQGDQMAFVGHSANAQFLWVRSLRNDAAQQLDGTQGAMHPFWSPDGKYVGFFANGKLNKIAASGGPVSVLAEASTSRGGTWGAEWIVFSPSFQSELQKVSAQGGTPTPATVMDKQKHTTHRWPWFLPDGKHFLFLATSHNGGEAKTSGIYFGSIDNTESRLVVATDSAAQYGSGYLLYRANTSLVAQPFDPESGRLSGSPLPLVNNIRYDAGVWRSIFAVSQDGLIVYQANTGTTGGTRLVWLDRSGKQLDTISEPENMATDVRLSPDGKRVAFIQLGAASGVWTLDLERKIKTRITFDQQTVAYPSWSPDGKTLMFTADLANRGGTVEIRSKAVDGSGTEKTLTAEQNNYHSPEWSRDGKYLTYLNGDGEKMVSLWAVPVAGDAKPFTVVQPPSPQSNVYTYRVSPDSRWVAYESDESGAIEIYVTTFPEGKGKWRVSTSGGANPVWSGNMKELFYRDLTDQFFVCRLTFKGSEIEVGTPQRLFHAGVPGVGIPYDVSADGQRLLVDLAEEEGASPLSIAVNWPAELKK